MATARVFLHSSGKVDQLALFDLTAGTYTKQGTTTHFVVFYAQSLGANGLTLANAVLLNCEADYNQLQGWFGNINVGSLPFNVYIRPGSNGASHASCPDTGLFCDAFNGTDSDLVQSLVVAEEDEVFMANQNAGWNCGGSNGEALSRVLAAEIYPNELTPPALGITFATAPSWLVSNRPNWVDNTEGTDRNFVSLGCGTLFINWLRFQLGFNLNQIVQAGGATLAHAYYRLTHRTDAFDRFTKHVEFRFPLGSSSGLANDNPFPYPVPPDPIPLPPVAPAVVATTSPRKAICVITSGSRVAQVYDTDVWNLDFPAEAAGQGGLRFQGLAVVSTTPPKKSICALTTDGRLAQIYDTDIWNLDFPAEAAGQDGLRFQALAVVSTTPPKKSICALTTDGRLAQIYDTDRWNLDFPAEAAGQDGLRFQALAVVSTTSPKKSICALTTDGRLAQIYDTDRWNLDFPAEAAGQGGLRFQALAVVSTTPPKKSICALTTDGRLAQIYDNDRWNLDFPAEAAGQGGLRFQALAVVSTTPPKKSICALTTDGQLAQIYDTDRWNFDFPAEAAGQGGLRFQALAVVSTTPPKKSICALTTDGRLAQIYDTDRWNLDFPAESAYG